ncbi:probable galacturonosyltransferase 7 isoform X2 [Tanacetum coccineum]
MSFIDGPEFINGYGTRHMQPHSRILMYKVGHLSDYKYICLVDDDIKTFKVQQQEFVVSPFFKHYFGEFVGECHGLLCLFCASKDFNDNKRAMLVVWNPSIGKSFGIALPRDYSSDWIVYGFGVCPVTSDPTVVRVSCQSLKPWHAEVFTLSSGVWNVIPSSNLLRRSVRLNPKTQAVIDRFIYWGASERSRTVNDDPTINQMVVSFDMITKEFKVVNLPDYLRKEVDGLPMGVAVAKLRGSLVVSGYIMEGSLSCLSCGVWVMERDSSFRKLFTIIGAYVDKILGFGKSGEPIMETRNVEKQYTTLDVYDPCSHNINSLGISAVEGSFVMDFYKESLLLLDHSDLHIYPYVKR